MKIEPGAYGLFYAHDETLLPGSMIMGETEEQARTLFRRAYAAVESGYAKTPGIVENHTLVSCAYLTSQMFLPIPEGMTHKQRKEAAKIADDILLSVIPAQGNA